MDETGPTGQAGCIDRKSGVRRALVSRFSLGRGAFPRRGRCPYRRNGRAGVTTWGPTGDEETAMRVDDLILVSVDDHVVEPPDMFEGHVPAKWREQAPRSVRKPEGHEVWVFE